MEEPFVALQDVQHRRSQSHKIKQESGGSYHAKEGYSDKENDPPNFGALNREQRSAKRGSKLVRFSPYIPLSKQEAKEVEMETRAVVSLQNLILLWAKQAIQAQKQHSNYKDRLVVNFQPGLTPKYIKYLITTYTNLGKFKDSTYKRDQQAMQTFIDKFGARRDRVEIVDHMDEKILMKVKDLNDGIIILCVEDLTNPDSAKADLIKEQIRSNHNCLLVLSKPICGLKQSSIEKHFGVKVRHIWFPRLDPALPLLSNEEYKYSKTRVQKSFGIPAVLELNTTNNAAVSVEVNNLLALWNKPEFKPYLGYFYRLFSFAHSQAQVYTTTMLSPDLSVLDAATILGFEVYLSSSARKDSDGKLEEPGAPELKAPTATPPKKKNASKSLALRQNDQAYSVNTLDLLKVAFNTAYPNFDAFKLIRGSSLKWFEAERAVARAIANRKDKTKSFGYTWPFFATSCLAHFNGELTIQPQVIPKVCKNGSEINEVKLQEWTESNRERSPQSTMMRTGWATLFPHLLPNAVIIPIEMSKSPDIMFLLRSSSFEALLCFQIKTGTQDPDVTALKHEIAKCPFLELDSTQTRIKRTNDAPNLPIVFVYVGSVHTKIKAELVKDMVETEMDEQEHQSQGTNKTYKPAVTKNFTHIQVTEGSQVLPLPANVEVIVLLNAGLMSLYGADYETLLDPLSEIKSLAQGEVTREALQNRSEALPNTEDEVRSAFRTFFDSVKHVPGADKIVLDELFSMKGK